MASCRVLFLGLAALLAVPDSAAAQLAGAPAMPDGFGYPGTPGMPGYGPAQPPALPPACQRLMGLRDDAQKAGLAVQTAGKKRPTATEACKLFNTFSGAQSKFVRGLEDNKTQCGVPDDIIKRVKAENDQLTQIRKRVCEAAAGSPGFAPQFPRDQEPWPAHDPYLPRRDID